MAWDLADAGPVEETLDVGAEGASTPNGVRFGDSGNLLFYSDNDGLVRRHTLTTPYDIATAGASDQSFDTGFGASLWGLEFKPDGTKLYAVDDGTKIAQFPLSTAWDLTTVGGEEASSAIGSGSNGIRLKPDGTKLYLSRPAANRVGQYPISTAWDISTTGALEASLSLGGGETQPRDCKLKDDGTKVYYVGESTATIYQHALSTPWDLDSASTVEASLDISADTGTPRGMEIGDSGNVLLYSDRTAALIHQRSLVAPSQTLAGAVASDPWVATTGALSVTSTLDGAVASDPWTATDGALAPGAATLAGAVAAAAWSATTGAVAITVPEGARDTTFAVHTALGQLHTAPRSLVEIGFDSGTLRLWTGLGDLQAMGETWTGAGRLGEIDAIRETQEVVASGIEMRILIEPTNEQPDAVDEFLNIALAETYQGRPLTIWHAEMDPATGQLIADPFIRFRGKLDVMIDSELPGAAVLRLTAENRLVDLERARNRAYLPEDQRTHYPDDSFFDGVAALQNREIVLK